MNPSELLEALGGLRDAVATEAQAILAGWQPWVERPEFAESARNLACYLALRHRDLRRVQDELMVLGLSSLGRLEGRRTGASSPSSPRSRPRWPCTTCRGSSSARPEGGPWR
jgi:hypothetical protein